jgi:tRNA pseudouridine38-40 synthase
VQEVLEKALGSIFKGPVSIVGCGRTDAGVHASQFYFHADLDREWDFDLLFRLNKVLPDDVAVFDIIPMQGLPHARFDSNERSYDYFIHRYKNPFLSYCSSYYPDLGLDFDKMKAAVALLPLYNDYRAFCKCPDRNEHTICHVSAAALYMDASGDRLRFHITANRFLGKMIRIIVSRLLTIGQGKMPVEEFERYLIEPHTPSIILPAHPQGLYLSKVSYPYLNLPARASFSEMLMEGLQSH